MTYADGKAMPSFESMAFIVRVVNSMVDKNISNGQAALEDRALSQSIGLR